MTITEANERLLKNVWGVVIDAPKYYLLLSSDDAEPKELEKVEVSHGEFFVYWLPAADQSNINKTTKTQTGTYVTFNHCYMQLGNETEQLEQVAPMAHGGY